MGAEGRPPEGNSWRTNSEIRAPMSYMIVLPWSEDLELEVTRGCCSVSVNLSLAINGTGKWYDNCNYTPVFVFVIANFGPFPCGAMVLCLSVVLGASHRTHSCPSEVDS